MGRDGSEGLQAIYGRDGITIAQSESTCVVYGMPKEAVALGVVKHVVDLDDMPAMFMQLAEKEG
jgi:two-component system chemotaxis response regulator CheB